ncbi:unnamed protein product [Rhizophagus irregularis]|uniref:Uncharacterized protein n=1 Tax=Rhizophagus irregularis TaxID=588596 RepID=A0A915YSR7_9GLOM|nr:unnamed protein product [Rhizophagus irregularis]
MMDRRKSITLSMISPLIHQLHHPSILFFYGKFYNFIHIMTASMIHSFCKFNWWKNAHYTVYRRTGLMAAIVENSGKNFFGQV